MKKKITNPEVKVVKLQKMNVIATSGGVTKAKGVTIQGLTSDKGGAPILYPGIQNPGAGN